MLGRAAPTLAAASERWLGPSNYYPKYESKYFRFKSKPKYVKILQCFESKQQQLLAVGNRKYLSFAGAVR